MNTTIVYDGITGLAGGAAFGAGILALAADKDIDQAALAADSGLDAAYLARVIAGEQPVGVTVMARLVKALRTKAILFLQKTDLLGLATYASGLDPLYFLPDGKTRFDARIYMREINPRHAVPEGDMLGRNPVLKALTADTVLDDLGKLEIELAYLLRAAVQGTGGTL